LAETCKVTFWDFFILRIFVDFCGYLRIFCGFLRLIWAAKNQENPSLSTVWNLTWATPKQPPSYSDF